MEDKKIVQLFWDRDQNAITQTEQKYGSYCASIAGNILGNKEEAEECVNDTYLNAWNSIPPHKPENLSTFLAKITRNISLNRYRHIHADKRGGHSVPAVLEELLEVVSDADTVEQEIDKRELLKTIDNFLANLPSKKRNIFVCRYWYFDDISDIAKRFRMTENNVSVTLNRLRKQLHDYLIERGYEL